MRTKVSSITVILILVFQCGAANAQERIKLRVSSAAKTLGYGPLWIASKMGFFARERLDVDPVVIRASDVGMQALAGGSLEIAGSAADAPIAAIEKGLEYPRDYKLLVIGGTPQTYAPLTAGSIDAAALSLPVNYAAEEQGFNEIGRFVDVIPNYQLAALSAKRSWAEKNRGVLVRVMKAMAQTMRWIHQNKEPAVDYLAKEMNLKREHARRGWEFYSATKMWHPDGDLNVEGLQAVTRIYWEQAQSEGAVPSAAKYIDQSYLREALKELTKG